MKIVNKEEFLKLPPNTVFATSEEYIIDDMRIKQETYDDGKKFYYISFQGIEAKDGNVWADRWEKMLEEGESYPVSLNSTYSIVIGDETELFAIYDKEDIKKIINSLTKCL